MAAHRHTSQRSKLTAARLREVLSYNPRTGVFRWRVRTNPHGVNRIGTVAGWVPRGSGRYIQISVDGVLYSAGRLAFLYMTGKWPIEADHKNLNGLDNRWVNLRNATKALNGANRRANSNNTSGLKGVFFRGHYMKNGKKIYTRKVYTAGIKVAGQFKTLGGFCTAQEAHAAYVAAAKFYFGEYARGS